jgi:hypothetical protein
LINPKKMMKMKSEIGITGERRFGGERRRDEA